MPSRKSSRKKSRRGSKLKLVKVVKSPKRDKKYRAVFETDGRVKNIDFGAATYSDYNIHKDPERRQRYLKRHKSRENWNKPDTPGSLSAHLLWGDSTSLRKNITSFKKRFNL